jgi:hypothetical protein
MNFKKVISKKRDSFLQLLETRHHPNSRRALGHMLLESRLKNGTAKKVFLPFSIPVKEIFKNSDSNEWMIFTKGHRAGFGGPHSESFLEIQTESTHRFFYPRAVLTGYKPRAIIPCNHSPMFAILGPRHSVSFVRVDDTKDTLTPDNFGPMRLSCLQRLEHVQKLTATTSPEIPFVGLSNNNDLFTLSQNQGSPVTIDPFGRTEMTPMGITYDADALFGYHNSQLVIHTLDNTEYRLDVENPIQDMLQHPLLPLLFVATQHSVFVINTRTMPPGAGAMPEMNRLLDFSSSMDRVREIKYNPALDIIGIHLMGADSHNRFVIATPQGHILGDFNIDNRLVNCWTFESDGYTVLIGTRKLGRPYSSGELITVSFFDTA